MMSKNKLHQHELSQRHFRQIVCRSMPLRKQLRSVWGMTWRPGERADQASSAGSFVR